MRIGALCMLCMSRYVVHMLGVQAIEVIRVQRLCCVSSILFKLGIQNIYSVVSPGLYSFFLHS